MPPAGIQDAGEAAGGLQEPLLPEGVGDRDAGSLGCRGCWVLGTSGDTGPAASSAPSVRK